MLLHSEALHELLMRLNTKVEHQWLIGKVRGGMPVLATGACLASLCTPRASATSCHAAGMSPCQSGLVMQV